MAHTIKHHSCCNATEIPESEYLRLAQKDLHDNPLAAFRAEQQRLRKISAERASKWPNTLANLRLLREKARQDRLKKEEDDLIRIDQENVAIRHKERLEKINKANFLLERVHVKSLQSKAWINDVLKERAEQCKIQKIWKQKWADQDAYYHNEMLKNLSKYDNEEEFKNKKAYEATQLLLKAQNEQLEQVHKKQKKEKEETMIENEKMKKKIAEMNAIDDAEKQRKKDMAVAMTKEIVASNKKLGSKGDKEREMDEKLEKEIETYTRKKKMQSMELNKIKDAKYKAKANHESEMFDKLDKIYKTQTAKFKEDEEKYRKAKEKADDEALAAKQLKSKLLLAECHKSRQIQIEARNKLLEEERKDLQFEDEHVLQHIQNCIEEEKKAELDVLNMNKRNAEFLMNQMKYKREAKRIAKEAALHEDIEALIQLKADEEYLQNLKFE
ncbi:uncharacterized protein [Physcomitrium patens]|uniref:uncharacterized protein isoform X2 n=1 Tax=Physcomitrium patens TaxID=3218 RepID=UPI000D17E77D|nr:histone-lysine N-methyltransferase, H3 lysine-79 specific-like [Physcomitrium patens]|eukprot:XP_024357412.1 histone-lysine N-methyltransferase, H3 lysine-79 specific-like [Physcomitrella patens]